MLQLILHGIGDYFIQNDWMALNKKKKGWEGELACQIHCITYSLPFLFIGSWYAMLCIYVTHYAIDRTNIVAYALAIKNNVRKDKSVFNSKLEIYEGKKGGYDISNFGFSKERPAFITIWLYIITDNLCHIICNYLALKYL
jgi:Protein of unknown function (DUF3307)